MSQKYIVFKVLSLKISILGGKVVCFFVVFAKIHVFQQNSNFGEGIAV